MAVTLPSLEETQDVKRFIKFGMYVKVKPITSQRIKV